MDEFGLGFPPKLFSRKYSETTYSINAIPFGGFVKIFGEDPENDEIQNIDELNKKRSFYFKPRWIQVLVLIAGVTFNVIFAWLLISLGFMIGLPSSVDHPGLGQVTGSHTTITEVLPNSPAEKAGLAPGDFLESITTSNNKLEGDKLNHETVESIISSSSSNLDVVYKRGFDTKEVIIEPNNSIIPGKKAIGIAMDEVGILKVSLFPALYNGAIVTWNLLQATTVGILNFIYRIFIFKSDFSQVSGPIGIVNVVGQASALGFVYLLSLTALISINLAIINLLPFPALDGGRILFVLIEKIRGKALPAKFVRYVNMIGFALLIVLMIFVTIHDIWKL